MDTDRTPQRPKRRPRYSGKNPRHFHQKYKEHRPDQYPDTIQKVLESGKTPAGSHRPIMSDEILEILDPQPGEIAVDATLGYGGHAVGILKRILPGGRLIGIDTDPFELPKTESRLRELGFSSEVLTVSQTNYASLPQVLTKHQLSGVDLVLADLGCSSMQLDDPQRGFSFKLDGPLDLRMNPNKGRSAANLIEAVSVSELEQLLIENADEPHADIIARAIVDGRERTPIQTTRVLTQMIERVLGQIRQEERTLSVRRVYQALRISVNDEFSALEQFLRVLPSCLKASGRVAILSFHSGEDRRVKKAFQTGLREGTYSKISYEIARPSDEEVRANPRASSAKLRWAVRNADFGTPECGVGKRS
jgi:16S rRNA (cytosine1402-N4)-methyltransferase